MVSNSSPLKKSPPKKTETLEEAVARILRAKKASHISEIGEAIVEQWGGAREIAGAFRDTYERAPPGSMIRAKLLDRMLHFIDEGSTDDIEFDEETLSAVIIEAAKQDGPNGQTHPSIKEAGSGSGGVGTSDPEEATGT